MLVRWAFRDRVYGEFRDQLMSADVARLVVQLNNWIEGGTWLKANRPIEALLVERSVEDFAIPRIKLLYAKLLKQGAKARQGTLDDWHRARCKQKRKVVVVANRCRSGRSASRRLEEFLGTEGLFLTARIPERDIYPDLAGDGLTVFDRSSKAAVEQQQAWLPLVHAVEMLLRTSPV